MRKSVVAILFLFILCGCSNVSYLDESKMESSDIFEMADRVDIESNEKKEVIDSKHKIVNVVEAEEFLRIEISELKELEEYIYQESNEEAFMIIETDIVLQIINFEGSDNEYFMVYVGEQYEDHKVNWFWFYVSKDLDKILNYDIVDGELYSLSEWRESASYVEKFRFMYE